MATKSFASGEVLTASDVNAYLNNYRADLVAPMETASISATAATGTISLDLANQSVTYYTSNASANFVLNLRANSTTTLNTHLPLNDSVTHVFMVTNGTAAYYPTSVQVDGSAVTPKWQGASAPTAGNTNSVDAYTLTVIKTAATPTYVVLASQTRFA
jgi:hypothetical protein